MSVTNSSPYKGSLTREQFCFYEMRTTASLMTEGLSDTEVVERIQSENLFQYPTEKSLKNIAAMCLRRLNSMNDESLIDAVAHQPASVSKQICLYSMMKDSRLVWDFMLTVIAEKYRTQNLSFGRPDINAFFMRLQEQDEGVAAWSAATIKKIGQVLTRILIENEYLDNGKAEHLNPVLISRVLENSIRANGDMIALAAFNCFG